MKYVNAAFLVIAEAESKLKELIGNATADASYQEIPTLAELAKALSQLKAEGPTTAVSQIKLNKVPAASSSPIAVPAQQPTHGKFPRFEIDGNRLVKLGWSSKDKQVYEHRVNLDLVTEICSKLQEKITARKPFKMESLFPMCTERGDEVPSYQAYLVLKWLQEFEVVERKGKDGYVFKNRAFGPDFVADLWARTPPRVTE